MKYFCSKIKISIVSFSHGNPYIPNIPVLGFTTIATQRSLSKYCFVKMLFDEWTRDRCDTWHDRLTDDRIDERKQSSYRPSKQDWWPLENEESLYGGSYKACKWSNDSSALIQKLNLTKLNKIHIMNLLKWPFKTL